MYEIILTEIQVKQLVERLAYEVAADVGDRPLIVTGVLKGCLHFTSDLLRALSNLGVEAETDFIDCASYSGTQSTGEVKCILPPQLDCKGKYVLLADTVLETGRTLKKAIEIYEELGAEKVEACVLLDKKDLRKVEVRAKFVGMNAGNDFIIGYGLDFDQQYRNLPFVAKLIQE